MSNENDNSTLYSMGSIFAGLICAGLSWYLLAPLLSNIPLIILSIFIFAVTAWGIYEAFVGYDGSSNEPQTFGQDAVSPTVSKMGLTDRDAWTSGADSKAKPTTTAAKKAAAPKKASAPNATAKPAAKATAPKKAAAKTAKAPAKKTAAPKAAPKKAAAPKAAPKKAAAAKKAGPVRLKKAKGKADDLKLISGVGPKLENTLNGLGFWHFYQIADWKRADVAIVDDELSFKGRIDRDDWIKQAKKLAKKKA